MCGEFLSFVVTVNATMPHLLCVYRRALFYRLGRVYLLLYRVCLPHRVLGLALRHRDRRVNLVVTFVWVVCVCGCGLVGLVARRRKFGGWDVALKGTAEPHVLLRKNLESDKFLIRTWLQILEIILPLALNDEVRLELKH